MAEPLALACPSCGQPDAVGSACPTCGASLLVELRSTPAPERVRYQAARQLAELGPPARSFAELRARLERPQAVVLGPISRAFAQRALDVASGVGLTLEVHPAKAPSRRPVAGFSLALLLVVAAGALVASRVHEVVSRRAEAVAEDSSADPLPQSGAPAPVPELTTQKIGQVALDSVAALSCSDSLGTGFFIDRETLITNAHVLCRDGANLKVHLHDGRDLIGVVSQKDPAEDWARVRVLGAAAHPLEVGDPTLLQSGDRVVLIGSPHGLEFTLHEGQVSFVGRSVLGVGFVQINATVNPGNSGGPLLDARGRVVGMVTLKVLDAEGIGLALPIAYVVPPADAAGVKRWSEFLAGIARDDDQEVQKFRADMDRPLLVGVTRGATALILQHSRTAPDTVELHFELDYGGGKTCPVQARFERWVNLTEAPSDDSDSPRVRWLLHHAAGQEMFIGAGELDASRCPRNLAAGESEGRLTMTAGAEVRGRAGVDLRSLSSRAMGR